MTTVPVTSVNLPRTLVTMKWRPMKATSVCPGSISQAPGAGRTCPSTVRVGETSWVVVSDMVVLLTWCDE